jgi:hypothetical protein
MELRFGCNEIGGSLSTLHFVLDETATSQSLQYWLKGLCCFHVEDRDYPPPEWGIFDIKFLSRLQRTPLLARVTAFSESGWHRRFGARDESNHPWPDAWLKDSEGRELDGDLVRRLYAAFNEAADKASVLIYYFEPDPEYTSILASRDAGVQIDLRMTDEQIADWNAVAFKFLGERPPACALTVYRVMFARDDLASANCGYPTWYRFIQGHAHAAGKGYDLQFASGWDEVAFER